MVARPGPAPTSLRSLWRIFFSVLSARLIGYILRAALGHLATELAVPEISMKRDIFILFLLVATALSAQQPSEIRFQSVPDFLKLPPDLHLGEATGVAVNSKGHIFVFTRGNTTGPAYGASAAQLLEFTADGKFLREIDHHPYACSFAHTAKVDRDDK